MALDTGTSREDQADGEPAAEPPPKRSRLGKYGELPALVVGALVLALLVKALLFQSFFIPSPSMVPTLVPGDRVLVNKIPYYFHDPRRGDIIVFENPHANVDRGIIGGMVHWLAQGLGFSGALDDDYIKRVIGLPGDQISCKDGAVYVNGVEQSEPYEHKPTKCDPSTVPAGDLFVMGDNRPDSDDSRYDLGPVPIGKVVGKAFVIMWPPSHMGLLH